ncbi:hypothetical protein BFJ71_g14142 [Fusarium oxysporum]|nr:hypothetical protein BFJ71_g14142 [Fusarium oxysporum]
MTHRNGVEAVLTKLRPLTNQLSPNDLITRDHDDYSRHTATFSANANCQPAVVLIPSCADSLAEMMRFLYKSDLDFHIRGRGFKSPSARDVIVSLLGFTDFDYDAEKKLATVGVGMTWAEAAERMKELDPEYSLTYARTPSVGVGGSILHGGFSWMSSEFGMISDPINFIDAEVVKYDGSIVMASTEPELMWALRGSGGGFGIMTKVVLRAHQYPTRIWSGMILIPKDHLQALASKIHDFISKPQHPKLNFLTFVVQQHLLPAVLETDQLSTFTGDVIVLQVYDACGENHGREAFRWALEMPGAIDKTRVGDIKLVLDMQMNICGMNRSMAELHVLAMGLADANEDTVLRALTWPDKIAAIDKDIHSLTMIVPEFLVFSPPVGGVAEVAWPRPTNLRHYILAAVGSPSDGTVLQNEMSRQLIQHAPEDIVASQEYNVLPTSSDELVDTKLAYGSHWDRLIELRRKYDPEVRFKTLINP